MEYEEVKLDDLIQDPLNARTHSRRNIEAIKASLKQFGQQKPIIALENGTVLAGNGTLQAARELGWDTIHVKRFEDVDQARAFAIADESDLRAGRMGRGSAPRTAWPTWTCPF